MLAAWWYRCFCRYHCNITVNNTVRGTVVPVRYIIKSSICNILHGPAGILMPSDSVLKALHTGLCDPGRVWSIFLFSCRWRSLLFGCPSLVPNHVFVFYKSPEKPGVFFTDLSWVKQFSKLTFHYDFIILFFDLYLGVICFSHASFMTFHKKILKSCFVYRIWDFTGPQGCQCECMPYSGWATFHYRDLVSIWCFSL